MNANDKKVDQSTVEKDVALGETHDIGANLYREGEQLTAEELETEGAKVLRIIDWRIMPIVRDRFDISMSALSDSLTWFSFI